MNHRHTDFQSASPTPFQSGGTLRKPVGNVCFGSDAEDGVVQTALNHLDGDRQALRQQAVGFLLERAAAYAGMAEFHMNILKLRCGLCSNT